MRRRPSGLDLEETATASHPRTTRRPSMTETNEATAPTMRAMTYETYGEPENLALTEQPRPKVGPGEVLVRVRSASVNPVDWKLMSGGLDAVMDVRFPVVPGWDVAGVVEAVGFDTPEFVAGDEAAGLPLAGLTAWRVLKRLGVGEGDTVLVHGAAGGVGSIGVQLARS